MTSQHNIQLNILKRLRAEAELSLRDLENLSGVNERTINMLENNRQKGQLLTLTKLAKALNNVLEPKGKPVKVDDLLSLLDTGASERGVAARKDKKKGGAAILV